MYGCSYYCKDYNYSYYSFFFFKLVQVKLYYTYRVLNKLGNGHYTNCY